MKKIIVALLAGLAATAAAQAQTTDATSKAYVGIGVVAAKNTAVDAYKADAKIFGGYDFDQNWGIEAGYTRYGSTDFSKTYGGTERMTGSTKGYSTYVAGKYTVPINERFSAYGKLGVSYSERKYTNNLFSGKDTDSSLYAAVGAQYKLNQNLALTAEYERNGKQKNWGAEAGSWGLGVKYGF
jgi:OOP family OmpA-OmpF porin